ncbi:flagellar hook-associated protein FlgL [Metasolibacillus meyeri]|uniref:Flagellar hook-associated protein FlgL n=1 Tax=Metasolibacillus meyeri TaxID=1071052 RepID=A0AAW9NUR4_9BACL|nr:flagellar hook-associated protein FlgL [Metasolibacillus meyeri]MEC1178891.1 flagellar hook-associated protein FlgL [Metasolibacillus meyeri]
MRVTQSMLSSNMLRNLNTSYGKMGKLQEQLYSGKKVNRPSDDPVIAIKGMSYRTELDRTEQYKRNIGEANTWLDATDDALGQVGDILNRVKELVVQAANDTNTEDDRDKMKQEIDQIRNHLKDLANTQTGSKYIFSGTHTDMPLYVDGAPNPDVGLTVVGANSSIEIDVFEAVRININMPGQQLFQDIDSLMGDIADALETGSVNNNGTYIGGLLGDLASGSNGTLANVQNVVLEKRADVGARQNRVELMEQRLDLHKVTTTKQMSMNEDTEFAGTITELVTQESIHQAALSVGARIIQQTLVDFMR